MRLDLELDPRPVERGAAQAQEAIRQTGQEADRTQEHIARATSGTGQAIQRAFQSIQAGARGAAATVKEALGKTPLGAALTPVFESLKESIREIGESGLFAKIETMIGNAFTRGGAFIGSFMGDLGALKGAARSLGESGVFGKIGEIIGDVFTKGAEYVRVFMGEFGGAESVAGVLQGKLAEGWDRVRSALVKVEELIHRVHLEIIGLEKGGEGGSRVVVKEVGKIQRAFKEVVKETQGAEEQVDRSTGRIGLAFRRALRAVGARDVPDFRGLSRSIQRAFNAGPAQRFFQTVQRGAARAASTVRATLGKAISTLTNPIAIGAGAIAGGFGLMSAVGAAGELQAINTTMKVVAQDSAREMEFLRAHTERLGMEFTSTAKAYGGFKIAAESAGATQREVKGVFLSVAEAAAVMNKSVAEQQGIMRALEQMYSKGTVAAEELRGQLGERLPGAFNIMARALGVTTEELNNMLMKGEVMARTSLPAFAAELQKTFGSGLQDSLGTFGKESTRFRNSLFELRAELGTPIAEALTPTLEFLKELVRDLGESGLFAQIGTVIGDVFTKAGNYLRAFVAELGDIESVAAFVQDKLAQGWNEAMAAIAKVEQLITSLHKAIGGMEGAIQKVTRAYRDLEEWIDPLKAAERELEAAQETTRDLVERLTKAEQQGIATGDAIAQGANRGAAALSGAAGAAAQLQAMLAAVMQAAIGAATAMAQLMSGAAAAAVAVSAAHAAATIPNVDPAKLETPEGMKTSLDYLDGGYKPEVKIPTVKAVKAKGGRSSGGGRAAPEPQIVEARVRPLQEILEENLRGQGVQRMLDSMVDLYGGAFEDVVRRGEEEFSRLDLIHREMDVRLANNAVSTAHAMEYGFRSALQDMGTMSQRMADMGEQAFGSLHDNLGRMFEDIATGAASVEDAIRTMVVSILQDLARLAAQEAATQALGSIFGGGSSGGGGGFWASLFGGIARSHQGEGPRDIGAGERLRVIRDTESILTPAQIADMQRGGRSGSVTIINHTTVDRGTGKVTTESSQDGDRQARSLNRAMEQRQRQMFVDMMRDPQSPIYRPAN